MSGGCRAIRTPTSATMFEAPSVSEWNPSESTLTAPVRQPKRDLGQRDEQIESEDAKENAGDGGVTIQCSASCQWPVLQFKRLPGAGCGILERGNWELETFQNTRPFGTGHHRSCTLPMMYFLGTKPQCRLSELLLR